MHMYMFANYSFYQSMKPFFYDKNLMFETLKMGLVTRLLLLNEIGRSLGFIIFVVGLRRVFHWYLTDIIMIL